MRRVILAILFAVLAMPELAGAQDATPVAVKTEATLGGNALKLVPKAKTPGLQVVAIGPVGQFTQVVVIRNNGMQPVPAMAAAAIVRDKSGALVATGRGSFRIFPASLQPGEVALGFLDYGGVSIPADATFDVQVKTDQPRTFDPPIDFAIKEVTLREGNIIGIAQPPTGTKDVTLSVVAHACFDKKGNLLSGAADALMGATLLVDGTVPFQARLRGEDQCPRYLVAVGTI